MSKRVQAYELGELTVTFDPNRCIHSAACIRAQPDVFDSAARPWIRLERGAPSDIVTAVHRCPTGALRAVLRGEPEEIQPDPVTLRASRNGPLVVRGEIRVITENGEVIAEDRR